MKLKLTVALVALAGLAAALAIASPTRAGDGTPTTGATAAGEQHGKTAKDDRKGDRACSLLELKGSAGSGTLSFTVSRAAHSGGSLAGKQVTVTIPAGAALTVLACKDQNGGLTLRGLHVGKAFGQQPASTTGSSSAATAAKP